jgi:hypothetical protein
MKAFYYKLHSEAGQCLRAGLVHAETLAEAARDVAEHHQFEADAVTIKIGEVGNGGSR